MKTFLAAACATLFLATSATAETLPEPTGDVLLRISGDIQNETRDGVILLDRAMLEAMPEVQFTTSTIWTETSVEFTGVSLQHVLEHAGFKGANIEAVALNDYKVEIPAAEIEDGAPIIAYRMDGKEMSARDKGPLWIVYPYDEDAKFRSEVVYSRSIWQLDRIVAVE